MFDDEAAGPHPDKSDSLLIGVRSASIEPPTQRRLSGEVHQSEMLGPMEFVQMPAGRPSYWKGIRPRANGSAGVDVVCEVENDDLPGADHEACTVAVCRLQVQEAMICAQLINEQLHASFPTRSVRAADLTLTSIRFSAHPLADGNWHLSFRSPAHCDFEFTVVYERGSPKSVRIDSDTVPA